MKAKPPNRWQSMPASLTKTRRAVNASHTKTRQTVNPDKCAFWIVIIGSITVALFGA